MGHLMMRHTVAAAARLLDLMEPFIQDTKWLCNSHCGRTEALLYSGWATAIAHSLRRAFA